MVNAYTKMKPDSFKLQLQAVLSTYYEDIKGVQGASGCHKTRIVKRQFKDLEATRARTQRTPPPCRRSGPPRCNASAQPALLAQAAAGRRLQLLHLPPAL